MTVVDRPGSVSALTLSSRSWSWTLTRPCWRRCSSQEATTNCSTTRLGSAALLFGLLVTLVDFLPTIGGALAGIPTVLFALGHSLTAGIVTLVVFLVYTFFDNHFLNPIVMSRTVKVNSLLVFIAVLIGADIGSWVDGLFGGFVCVLLAIPVAGSIQVVVRAIWQATGPAGREPPVPPIELSAEMPPP